MQNRGEIYEHPFLKACMKQYLFGLLRNSAKVCRVVKVINKVNTEWLFTKPQNTFELSEKWVGDWFKTHFPDLCCCFWFSFEKVASLPSAWVRMSWILQTPLGQVPIAWPVWALRVSFGTGAKSPRQFFQRTQPWRCRIGVCGADFTSVLGAGQQTGVCV